MATNPGSGNRVVPVPKAHVIAEYKHRARTITCICGWHGSSEGPMGTQSPWTRHVVENRTTPARR
jgi:hypothetical protein